MRCLSCASVFSTEPVSPHHTEELHGDDYGEARGHGTDTSVMRAKQRTFERYLAKLGPPKGRLLEVGCSAGDGLMVARTLGWDVSGVEVNAAAATLANSRLGVDTVDCATLESYRAPGRSFSAITMFDVIEHFAAPREALRQVLRLLRPGGQLLLVTPDAGSLSARLLRGSWPHLLPEHRVLFTRRSLKRALLGTGFRVKRDAAAPKYLSTSMFRRHATLYPHVFGARGIRLVSALIPEIIAPLPVGEFYAIAERP